MKKEYLILIALILVFSAYLFLHKENRDHYTLPEIETIDTKQITGLVIDGKNGSIAFAKKDGTWRLTEKEYLADSGAVESMLDTLKTLKLSALVSQKSDLKRYELDDENRINVTLTKDEKALFEFTMGKAAPSFNHTFVMLANDTNIYHANGSFRSHFDKDIGDFRDKKVLEFKKESIKLMTIETGGKILTLTSEEEKKGEEEPTVKWYSGDGSPADNDIVSTLLSAVSLLECEAYLGSPSKKDLEKANPFCSIRLTNETDIWLRLFKTETQDQLSGISSMNTDSFALSSFNGKEIISSVETLLGIAKKEENKQ